MPVFNVLRINEKHLAKVRAVRNQVEVTDRADKTIHEGFIIWRKSITEILATQKVLSSSKIVHLFH